jgi:membrane protease YdiL (CAAX protease family)
VRLLVLLPLMLLVLVAVQGIAQAVGDDPVVALLVGLVSAAGALAVYRAVVARLERRPVDELRRPAGGGIVSGLGIGLGSMSATIGIIALFGGYDVTGSGSLGAAIAAVGTMAAVAATEELLFRGVVFRLAEEKLGTWGGIVLSAVLFAALHLVNPDADLWGALALSVEAGALLAAAFVATRSLWLPIGIHLAWNWAEGPLFGTVVSGSSSDADDSLLTSSTHGSALLTGAGFGPEASIPAILVCLVPTVLLMRLAAKRGRIVPAARPSADRTDTAATTPHP